VKRLRNLILEMRRRHVFRVAGIYIVAGWVAVQVADTAFPGLNVPDAAIRFVWLAVFLGFPLALVFGWRYDITAQGIVRTAPADASELSGLSLGPSDYVILGLLLAVAVTVVYRTTISIQVSRTPESAEITRRTMDQESLAVLPLTNISGETEQQYFVDGMHEALIAHLSRISALRVISRTSTRQYQDTRKPLRQIGLELGTANIIEGSVYRVGDVVRITIQLIDASADRMQWTHSYERKLENILRLQGEVATSIANEIEVALTAEEESYFSMTRQVDPEAYEDYLKGRYHWYRFTPEDLALARRYFQSALDRDPAYALAYVGLADAVATPAHIGLVPAAEAFPRAVELVGTALKLDPQLAEAHDLAARIRFVWDHDWAGAEAGFREAIRLNPGYPDVHVAYSQLLGINGRWEESLSEARTGLQLDPLNNWFQSALGSRLAWMGRYDEALERYQLLSESQPDWPMIYRSLSEVHYVRGELPASLAAAVKYYRMSDEQELSDLLSRFDAETEYAAAMIALAEKLRETGPESYVSEYELARIYAFSGNSERTILWLEAAWENRDTQLVYSAAEPLFSFIWDHPRYVELRRKMNLPERIAPSS
jgi:TolB-like protein/Tfp pilus assembly protein PilF